jgi:hypothetical protein
MYLAAPCILFRDAACRTEQGIKRRTESQICNNLHGMATLESILDSRLFLVAF